MTTTFNAKANTVIDNGKANSVLMQGVTAGTPPGTVQNNINLVINDPALQGVFKAGKSYTVTVTEVEVPA